MRMLRLLVVLAAVACGSDDPKVRGGESSYYGAKADRVAMQIGCSFTRVPYDGTSPRFDIPPSDGGTCTFPDGLGATVITWPTERAVTAFVELTPGLYFDYPRGD